MTTFLKVKLKGPWLWNSCQCRFQYQTAAVRILTSAKFNADKFDKCCKDENNEKEAGNGALLKGEKFIKD